MAHVTDYGLLLTELAGALMVLAFVRALVLYARPLLRPAPAIAPVRAPDLLRKASSQPTASASRETALPAAPANALEPTEIPAPGMPPLSAAESELSLSSVILVTKSVHTEEAADGSRSLYWSLTRFRHHAD